MRYCGFADMEEVASLIGDLLGVVHVGHSCLPLMSFFFSLHMAIREMQPQRRPSHTFGRISFAC